MLGIFLINLVSAENVCGNTNSFLGTYKQTETVKLKQVCDTCTYVNLSSVNYPNSSTETLNIAMTKNGVDYSYDFSNTTNLGCYSYSVFGDKDGNLKAEVIDFQITPSGEGGSSNTIFIIFAVLLIYGITFAGFYGRNIPVTILGGMAMIFLGIYLISQGVIIYRDNLTNYIAYLTIAIGTITAFWAILEQLEVI